MSDTTMLAKAKIDKSQLTEIPVKFDMTPLLTGDIDVWPGYLIDEVLAAKEKGFDVNVVYPPLARAWMQRIELIRWRRYRRSLPFGAVRQVGTVMVADRCRR